MQLIKNSFVSLVCHSLVNYVSINISPRFLKDAEEFLDELDEKSKKKILTDIRKTQAGLLGDWFRKMPGTDDIWEFRTLFNKTQYRVFAFWDTRKKDETLIICTHGLIKKTDKTPTQDIEKAERMKQEYLRDG